MCPQDETVNAPVPLAIQVTVVLHKLGSCGKCRIVANQFGGCVNAEQKSSFTFFFLLFTSKQAGRVTNLLHILNFQNVQFTGPQNAPKTRLS